MSTHRRVTADDHAAERGSLAAAALINAVGSLIEQMVDASPLQQNEIADRMGVTAGRVSQLVTGDGNVRIASLARLAEATDFTVELTATDQTEATRITVPRTSGRGARGARRPLSEGEASVVQPGERGGLAAAALINAVGSLMEQMVETSPLQQQEIADRMGVTPGRVSQLVTGDGNVRIASLARLAEATDFTVELTATDETGTTRITVPRTAGREASRFPHGRSAESQPEASAARRAPVRRRRRTAADSWMWARMNELAPVSVFRKRGVLSAPTVAEEAVQLCEFIGIDSPEDEPAWEAAARRHNGSEPITAAQRGWLACARREAQGRDVAPFDAGGLERLAPLLTRQTADPTAIRHLPARFAEVGVRLVHVEAIPGSRLDGASFLLDGAPSEPVIALSGRGKRLDKVVFTLLHEVAHVVRGHLDAVELLIDEEGRDNGDMETEANTTAADWTLPQGMTPPMSVDHEWIVAEAARQGVHPIFVIGRLQHTGRLSWKSPLAKAPPNVTEHLARW